ncbi:amidohydrolase [Cryptosporangium phraense]|uniref:Amidohydrolase n=1 Tax=Cryptosporangium phraense TaxID=2593070 RepID=A0A545ATY6_9ACTN|nr:amidohydrolase [Cryptosporangium phraense]TQS44784.1 amidohydrolase [Cryptosporangium phraense]
MTTLLVNGQFYLDDGDANWASAVAVTGTTISAVGDAAVAGSHTRVVDLDGATVLPGFVDAHVHPIMGGAELLECALADYTERSEYLAAVAAYGGSGWITGGGWSMTAFPGGVPDAASLDTVTDGRPAFLYNRDHHSAWVNTAALRAAGIDESTPDPEGGRIERDASGAPTGALHESAMDLVTRLLPAPGPSHTVDALRAGLRYLNSLGITGWQDAKVRVDPDDISAYLALQSAGELTARVVGAYWLDPQLDVSQVDTIVAARAALPPGLFTLGAVKIMLDGVCETHTASMSSPYLDGHGHSTGNTGISFFERDMLLECARRLDRAGFQLHFHAVGDAAVTEALDVVEAIGARHRPHVAHVQVVHPRDVHRFRALGVSVNAQPLWARLEPQMTELTLPFLGTERGGWQYPFGEFENAGATLAFGSDWPVSTPDPIRQLHVAVNRTPVPDKTRWTPQDGAFLPDQRLSLPVALRAFTRGSAWINHQEDVAGAIAVGRSADFAILDANPFDRPRSEIWRTKVVGTWFRGQSVHSTVGVA